jgi:tetratricopeptide (TPR) repeat protein
MLHPGHDFDAILHSIDIHIDLYPEHIGLRCARALLLFGISYFQAAREDLLHILYLQPHHLEAQLLLGESWYLSGQLDRAFNIVSHVLNESPSHIRANMVRVAVCQALARRSDSIERQEMYYNLALSDLDLLLQISPSTEIETLHRSVAAKLSRQS